MTAVLFSMIGYFNGNNKTVWVMNPGPDPDSSGPPAAGLLHEYPAQREPDQDRLAAPISTIVGIILNVGFFLYLEKKERK